MTAAADRIFTNAEVHTLAGDIYEEGAVAVRDGRIARVGRAHEVDFLEGVETDVVDCEGGTLLPGFVDAHTHMDVVGRRTVEADLAAVASPDAAVDALAAHADDTDGWVLGFGYDESEWDDSRYLTREDLDRVSTERPVAAFREDLHVVSVNSVVLDRLGAELPESDVRTEDGDLTGVLVEGAAAVVSEAIEPGAEATREYLLAAQDEALAKGITGVHDMVRNPHVPRIYRDLDCESDLAIRVRMNYWADFLDHVEGAGLRTNHGSDRLRTGAIKTYTDGSIGGATAKLSTSYADSDSTGTWVETPEALRELAERVDDAGLQLSAHAIGDAAIEAVLDALEGADGERHRIEHCEVLTDELIERVGAADVVVSAQPNFHRWAGPDGLYERRLGTERRRATNQFAALGATGARLAFGSDCMPMGPLYGIQQAVTAPTEAQRLSVTDAVAAYTRGSAYAGFDEDRLGTIEAGKLADLVVLETSPWDADPDAVADIEVTATVVGGEVAYTGRKR
jgi:predicted amidohydrolase YtcJ